jgi:hypothetical protein
MITNSISNVSDELVLWAFRRACLDQPTKSTMYYDALVAISKLPRRSSIIEKVQELYEEGN